MASEDKSAKQPKDTTSSPKKQVRYEVQPEFWDDLLDALPPWFDEIAAIVLLVFGVISFMALFGVSSDAPVSKAWADTLTGLFGDGSVLIAAGIFLMGVFILLPKIGVTIRFSTVRVLALEVAFLSVLAILHLSAGDKELRALARAGEGGGTIGWGVSLLPNFIFGATLSVMIFGLLLITSLGLVIGINREHLANWLQTASTRLQAFGQRFTAGTEKQPQPATRQPVDTSALTGVSRLDRSPRSPSNSVVRIRPDRSQLPPSLRIPAAAPTHPTLQEEPEERDEIDERLFRALEHSVDQPVATIDPEADFSIVGKLLPKKGKEPQLVERPDGRIKRYFNVESMQEPKKVGRRDKDLPPLDLLQDVEMNPPDENEINHNVVLIENTLLEFDIDIDVVGVKVGPTVTQYAVQPFRDSQNDAGDPVRERTRLSKIAALVNDLALSLSAKRLRMETPVPGHSYMGIEVPNKNPSTVALRSVYESKDFFDLSQKAKSPLLVPLGRDVSGAPVTIDIATMPHLLIAGTTGSGKSVCIAAMACALILHNTPDVVKLIMLDPKMVELSRFNGLPHLLGPVETDMERIIGVLRWCTREMDRRYKLLEENAARNIEIYNSRLGQRRKSEHLPYIVILVDEIGDLMMTKPEETERTITRIAQMARAVGMHLVVATQRPSVDVITGLIKANFPGRISFAVATSVDSRVILDTGGADSLLGKGDMLFLASDAAAPKRLQGCYVQDSEVRSLVQYWIDWHAAQKAAGKGTEYGTAPWERGLTRREFLSETDPMLEDAIELVVEEQEASASMIQRKLGLGYPRAARIMDLLEELGVVGEPTDGGRSRKVLIEKGKDPFQELIERRAKNR